MENTPQQNTALDAQASVTAAKRKQLEKTFEDLQAIQEDLKVIANLEVRNQQMRDDIAKQVAALKIELPK
jgi:hypothetical protein